MLLMHIQKCERAIIQSMETQQEEPVIDYGLVDEEKVNEPIQSAPSVDDTKIPFGEEKQLEARNLCK